MSLCCNSCFVAQCCWLLLLLNTDHRMDAFMAIFKRDLKKNAYYIATDFQSGDFDTFSLSILAGRDFPLPNIGSTKGLEIVYNNGSEPMQKRLRANFKKI